MRTQMIQKLSETLEIQVVAAAIPFISGPLLKRIAKWLGFGGQATKEGVEAVAEAEAKAAKAGGDAAEAGAKRVTKYQGMVLQRVCRRCVRHTSKRLKP